MNNTVPSANEPVEGVGEDWSKIEEYDTNILAANELMVKAEISFETKHYSIVHSIKAMDVEIEKFITRTSIIPEVKIATTDEEKSNKRIFRDIASLCHPDREGGNEALFKKAKKALKEKNRTVLNDILNEAHLNYFEILNARIREYDQLVCSERYAVAKDWFSADISLSSKAETYYLSTVLNNMKIKQAMLESLRCKKT